MAQIGGSLVGPKPKRSPLPVPGGGLVAPLSLVEGVTVSEGRKPLKLVTHLMTCPYCLYEYPRMRGSLGEIIWCSSCHLPFFAVLYQSREWHIESAARCEVCFGLIRATPAGRVPLDHKKDNGSRCPGAGTTAVSMEVIEDDECER